MEHLAGAKCNSEPQTSISHHKYFPSVLVPPGSLLLMEDKASLNPPEEMTQRWQVMASDQGAVEVQGRRPGLTHPPHNCQGRPGEPYSQRQLHAGYTAGCPSGMSAQRRQSR